MEYCTPTLSSDRTGHPKSSLEKNARSNASSITALALPPSFVALIHQAHARTDLRALDVAATANKAGIGKSTLWRDVKRGVFAPPIRLSPRRVGWLNAEVDAILAAKTLMTRSGQAIDLEIFVTLLIAPRNHEPNSEAAPNI